MTRPSASRSPAAPVPDATGFLGFAGFDHEAVRAENLRGRQFSAADRQQRAVHFHQSHVDLGTRLSVPSWATPGQRKGASLAADPNSTAGVATGYGVGANSFNLISGTPRDVQWELGPPHGAYAKRVPLHMLSEEVQARALERGGEREPSKRVPSARGAGAAGVTRHNFLEASQAMRHPASLQSTAAPDARQYTSFNSLNSDRRNKRYTTLVAADVRGRPLRSSDAYGAFFTVGDVKSPGLTRQGTGPLGETSPSALGARAGAVFKPRVLCSETGFAESIKVGSRHAAGHVGQAGR